MTDFPYVREITAEGRMEELQRHREDVHAHISAIGKLNGAGLPDAFDLGTAIQGELREMRRLIDEMVSLGEQPSADALWLDVVLWPRADERPLDGEAAKALAGLSTEMRAALKNGRESVKQERSELRLLWQKQARKKPGPREGSGIGTLVAHLQANEGLAWPAIRSILLQGPFARGPQYNPDRFKETDWQDHLEKLASDGKAPHESSCPYCRGEPFPFTVPAR